MSKKLTKAQQKRRNKIAEEIEKENPGISKRKKFGAATNIVKKARRKKK